MYRTQAATFLLGVKPVRFFSKLLLAVGTCETNRVPLHCLDQKVFHHHLTLGMSVSKPAQGMPFFMGSSTTPNIPTGSGCSEKGVKGSSGQIETVLLQLWELEGGKLSKAIFQIKASNLKTVPPSS